MKKTTYCIKKCAEEFTLCMQVALDNFAMGACYDAQTACQKNCPYKKSKSYFQRIKQSIKNLFVPKK